MDGQENRHQALCLLAALVTIGGPAMGRAISNSPCSSSLDATFGSNLPGSL